MEGGSDETRDMRARQAEAVRRITAARNARLPLEELARQALLAAAETVGANGGSLLLHDLESSRLVFQAVLGPAAAMLTGQSIRDDEGMAGRVLQSAQSQSMAQGAGGRQRSLATVPLKTPGGQVIGVLQVADRDAGVFDTHDLAVLEALASFAAAAIDAARGHPEAPPAGVSSLDEDEAGASEPIASAEGDLSQVARMLEEMLSGLDAALDAPDLPAGVTARIRQVCAPARDWCSRSAGPTPDAERGWDAQRRGPALDALIHRRQAQDAERERQVRLQQELAIGRRIQMSLLPPRRLCRGSFEILSRSEPASEVGGDFCNLFEVRESEWGRGWRPSPGTRLGVVLGDVAGKGVGAALFMAVTTTLIQAQGQLLLSPSATLAAANAELYPKMRPSGAHPLFATAVYGVLDLEQGEIRLANAGQTPPIYWPAAGPPRYLRVRGLPLGALPASQYDEMVMRLAPGDRLLFCSDGFIEDRDADGSVVGYDRFLQRLEQHTRCPGPELIETIFAARDSCPAEPDLAGGADDCTLVLIAATGPVSG